MVDFAITNFYEATRIRRVPKLPTIWDELKDFWNYEVEHKGGVLNVFLMKTEEGRVHFGALFLVYVMPIGTVYVFYLLMKYAFATDGTEVERTQKLNQQNAAVKKKLDDWV